MAFCLVTTLFSNSISLQAQALIDVETGLVFTGYNNVRIPGNQGTLLSLKDDLNTQAIIFFRGRLTYTLKSRHTFSLLIAPFQIKSEGSLPFEVLYEGVLFPEQTYLEGTYKFNSYRLTYRYDILKRQKIEFGLGFTAKIRDAKISLMSPDLYAEKTNVGFVPIINFRMLWKANEKLGVLLEGDVLGASQGRAADVQLALTYKQNNQLGFRAGYRILEGGSDGSSVYNFALFNYASLGVSYTFRKKSP